MIIQNFHGDMANIINTFKLSNFIQFSVTVILRMYDFKIYLYNIKYSTVTGYFNESIIIIKTQTDFTFIVYKIRKIISYTQRKRGIMISD